MRDEFENNSGLRIVGNVLIALAVVAVCVIGVFVALNIIVPNISSQGTVSLRHAIMQSANQCYAIEGSYPYNLEYLENNYGLVVNHDDYAITYEVFADNVAPSVVVVEK